MKMSPDFLRPLDRGADSRGRGSGSGTSGSLYPRDLSETGRVGLWYSAMRASIPLMTSRQTARI